MRVFVSGGTGYVGSALTSALLDRGHDVTLLCHEREPVARPGLALVRGDVRLSGEWTQAPRGQDAAIHLVAVSREWVKRGVAV